MAKKLGDLIKNAFKEAGVELPKRDVHPQKPAGPPASPAKPQQQHRSHPNRRTTDRAANTHLPTQQAPRPPRPSVYSPDRPNPEPTGGTPSTPAYTLTMSTASRVALDDVNARTPLRIIPIKGDGRATTLHKAPDGLADYELTLGFDFGTSSTKVVIGDPQQDKAFAVPFVEANGIERFLLPGRLFRDSEYSLVSGKESFRDLKLALLGSNDDTNREHAVAFMALAIRHARAWLFENYEPLFRDKHIFWNLAVGMPSTDLRGGDGTKGLLEHLALAAWIASTEAAGIDTRSVQRAISCAVTARGEGTLNPYIPDVLVHPEVAAQIFGFVSGKDAFDPNGRNLYLLVDIGAGTIDTSLFHVTRASGNRWDFVTFTSTVEFNGAINLHRSRIQWWVEAVSTPAVSRKDLVDSLETAARGTDCSTRIPPRHEDYVFESSIRWARRDEHPDAIFMSSRVRPQILDKTYVGAWKQGHLEQADIFGVPTFLCGGGMRMPFYAELLKILDRREPNAAWVHAKPRQMSVPERLEAKGLATADYDRLSVAYGLSLMRVGSHTRSDGGRVPISGEDRTSEGAYISKEMT